MPLKLSDLLFEKYMEYQKKAEKRKTLKLETMASQIRELLTSGEIDDRKYALRMLINRILVKRTDIEILALIEYHLPENNIPSSSGGGDIWNKGGGPEGYPTISLIIPIHKYSFKK